MEQSTQAAMQFIRKFQESCQLMSVFSETYNFLQVPVLQQQGQNTPDPTFGLLCIIIICGSRYNEQAIRKVNIIRFCMYICTCMHTGKPCYISLVCFLFTEPRPRITLILIPEKLMSPIQQSKCKFKGGRSNSNYGDCGRRYLSLGTY